MNTCTHVNTVCTGVHTILSFLYHLIQIGSVLDNNLHITHMTCGWVDKEFLNILIANLFQNLLTSRTGTDARLIPFSGGMEVSLKTIRGRPARTEKKLWW